MVADSPDDAKEVLLTEPRAALWERDIRGDDCTVVEVPMTERCVLLLDDGEY